MCSSDLAFDEYLDKNILGAQRALQFGGEQLLKHHTRMYNCSSSYVDRPEFFKELMYILLCGAGAGYSVQKHHVDKLPVVQGWDEKNVVTYVVPDSIEGWALAIDEMIKAFFSGSSKVWFDFSQVRPKGSPISGGFKAPGHEPLKVALLKIKDVLRSATGRKLRPFEVHRISCLLADAVISGGIRRSALLCLFDAFDEEMLTCKTGKWWHTHLELARSNNSAVILPDTPRELYDKVFKSCKEFGEPGFAFLKDSSFLYNPCFEVGMLAQTESGQSGWSFCNLTNVNVANCKTEEDLYKACRASAYLGTIQAFYTEFNFLGDITKEIVRRDALIGVGLTGMCENPDLIFDKKVQIKAANIVKEANAEMAKILGISTAARTTVVKPDGNTSQFLGTSSGIHPFEAKHYLRHIQLNNQEQALEVLKNFTPNQVEDSWEKPGQESVAFFPVTIPKNALTLDKLSAIDFLELVKVTQNNWIEYGTNFDHPSYKKHPTLRMNVSNTCKVADHEWDEVQEYLWNNRRDYCGISLLSRMGDLAFRQAPYTTVYDEKYLADNYGAGAILAGGLIVDGLKVFNNLWDACDAALGWGEHLLNCDKDVITKFIASHIKEDLTFLVDINGIKVSDVNAVISNLKDSYNRRIDWVRRFNKFANNYLNGDLNKTAECLKRVSIFHKWNQAINDIEINWNSVEWENVIKDAGADSATGCSGGACEIVKI